MNEHKTLAEKRKEAIALRYDEKQSDAPSVIAKGKGQMADQILKEAIDHQIPIQEDPTLVELLSKLNKNDNNPRELYKPVVALFAFIYKADRQAGKKKEN